MSKKLQAWLSIVIGSIIYALIAGRPFSLVFEAAYWSCATLLILWWAERNA